MVTSETTKKTIFRDFTKYVSMSVIGMICVSFYVFADTIFIAIAMGSEGLAALTISMPIFGIVHGIGLMIGIGGATLYSIMKNKNDEDAATVFTHSLIAGLFASTVFVLAGIFFTTPLAKAFGADADILPMAAVYMQTILHYAPALVFCNILIAFLRNDKDPQLAMAGMVTASLSNIVLDYVFLFPLSMGMFGAALATGLSSILSAFVMCAHFFKKSNRLSLRKCKIKIGKLAKTFSLGASTLINELAFTVSVIVFNLVILRIEGNIGVAAFGIVANSAFVIIAIFVGVAQGIQPLISKGHGRGDKFLLRQTIKYAAATVFSLALLIYGAVFFNAPVIVSAFNIEADISLAFLATNGMKIYFIGLVFAGLSVLAAAFFSASDNAKAAVAISVLRSFVINIPLVIILGTIFGMNGVWSSYVLTELLVSLLSVAYFLKNSKLLKRRSCQ